MASWVIKDFIETRSAESRQNVHRVVTVLFDGLRSGLPRWSRYTTHVRGMLRSGRADFRAAHTELPEEAIEALAWRYTLR